jgi:imidazolonepropionase-like amidohydrolase
MKTLVIAAIGVLVSAAAFSQDTTYYSFVSKGKIAGEQRSWQTTPGEYHFAFHYNDRGRGDSTVSLIRVDTNGLIISLKTEGVDYYKNPYTETFTVAGDTAQWTINGNTKKKRFDGQLYNANNVVPGEMELLIRVLEKQKDRKIRVLPGGTIRCDEPRPITLSMNGQSINLKMYTVYFDPDPSPLQVWLTDDLHFFAGANPWSTVIPKGYETWSDSLVNLQEKASQPYYEAQLRRYSADLPARIAFTHATLFHSPSATVQKNMTVELNNAKVVAVYPSSLHPPVKQDTVVDCNGKFLMPGLWDMHAHYTKESGLSYLAGGVTHVRDMGNEKILLNYKRQIAENALLGPDISYLSGFIDKEGPFQGPTGAIVSSLGEALKAVDDYHELGYQQIKLYSSIEPEWVAPIANRAHSYGMRLCGHVPSMMTATEAINAGYDEITHMNFIFLNFMGDTVDTRSTDRFRLPGLYAGKLDLNSPEVQEFVELMKEKHISLDPTMVCWDEMFNLFKGDTNRVLKPLIKWLPANILASLTDENPYGSNDDKPAYQSSFRNMLKMLKLLYDNGILLVPGTDGGELLVGEANALHFELSLYTQAGIPANQVLRIATFNCAVDCNLQNKYGEIRPGLDADFILIDGDPINNIADIRRVELVVKNKKIYLPKQLLASKGWKYYYR